MKAWEMMESIRERLSDTAIVDELVQYLSTDELTEFCQHLDDACLDGTLFSDDLYDEEDVDYGDENYSLDY